MSENFPKVLMDCRLFLMEALNEVDDPDDLGYICRNLKVLVSEFELLSLYKKECSK